MYELIAFDPVNAGYGVSDSPLFRFFSWGAYPGMHSGLTVRLFLQWHLVLNVQLQKTPHVDKTNDNTEQQWSKIYIILDEKRSLNTKETMQNETT